MPNASPAPAGLRVRLLAFGFDYLLIAAYVLSLVVLGVVANWLSPSTVRLLFGSAAGGQASGFVLITLPVTLYFAFGESSTRRATWGKRRAKLVVTDLAGSRLSFARSLVRTMVKFIPWELAHLCIWQVTYAQDPSNPIYAAGFIAVWLLVGIDACVMYLGSERQTIHDRVAGALVVLAGSSST